MKVLLGVTGSVATVLTPKLVEELQKAGHEVQIVATNSSTYFFSPNRLNVQVWQDDDEWPLVKTITGICYEKGQLIPHIELRKWADVLVVAPLSANTLAKFANGLCDNLITSVFRAWDFEKPVVLAPAMNTQMWMSPFTQTHLGQLKLLRTMTLGTIRVVNPQEKVLACGDEGIGAMADISAIVEAVNKLDKTQSKVDQPPAEKTATSDVSSST